MNEYKQRCCCEPSRDYEDCRYYSVAFDMGANIAHCTLNPPHGMEALSYCPCIDNGAKCKQYISKKDPNGDFIAGQQRMADRVLEIIDDVFMEVANGLIHTSSEALEETHNRVKALRGEQ